ncbi:MAG: preprotein translocase subunit SecE [Sphingomonadaceae bacterium]
MAKTSPGEFVRQVRQETAKVVWPTRPEVVRTTILVLIMTSILALFFLLVDQVLGRAVRLLLGLGD